MPKRTLEDIFNEDTLGLLDVSISKSSKQSIEAIYYGTFEEIQEFMAFSGREPDVNAKNIHEAKLAVRLEQLRTSNEALEALTAFDTDGLLDTNPTIQAETIPASIDDILDNDLLADDDDIFSLRHVTVGTKTQSSSEDMAKRVKCEDFSQFDPLFKSIQKGLDSGVRQTQKVQRIAEIKTGQSFILSGLIAYVAEIGEKHERRKGHHNARMRVIFSNGMESNLLLRSFGAALYKDKTARAITGDTTGPLFENQSSIAKSGIVYVLKSKSTDPEVAKHKAYLHKIGITKSEVKKRIAHAAKDSTYLLADVEIVAEFTLYNMNLNATEKLLHTFFREAQADIKIPDRFNQMVSPKEWFFLPLETIKQAIALLRDGEIGGFKYNKDTARITRK
jgi:hypothetical protein